jgi:sentrin-specific protease 1
LGGKKLARLENIVMNFADAKKKSDLKFFPLMTLKEMELVNEIWNHKGNMEEEVIIHEHILEKLTFRNLATLKDQSWLNDEVINAYIRLINNALQVSDPRRAVMNTYFFDELTKKKVDKSKLLRILSKRKIDIAGLDQLFLPYNQNNVHWCFYCIDFRDSTIIYYDSLSSHTVSHEEQLVAFANMILEARPNPAVIHSPFRKVKKAINFPSQGNGYDCGVFLLKGIDCLSRANKVNFDQFDLEYLRYLITFELVAGKFLNVI